MKSSGSKAIAEVPSRQCRRSAQITGPAGASERRPTLIGGRAIYLHSRYSHSRSAASVRTFACSANCSMSRHSEPGITRGRSASRASRRRPKRFARAPLLAPSRSRIGFRPCAECETRTTCVPDRRLSSGSNASGCAPSDTPLQSAPFPPLTRKPKCPKPLIPTLRWPPCTCVRSRV